MGVDGRQSKMQTKDYSCAYLLLRVLLRSKLPEQHLFRLNFTKVSTRFPLQILEFHLAAHKSVTCVCV